jgi:hypothetical protein
VLQIFIIERQSTNVLIKLDGTSQVFFASTIRPAIVARNLASGKEKGQGSAVGDPADPLLAPLPSNPTLEGVPTL